MIYAAPGTAGAKVQFKAKYDNFIGGKSVAPVKEMCIRDRATTLSNCILFWIGPITIPSSMPFPIGTACAISLRAWTV